MTRRRVRYGRCSQCGQRWTERACGPTHAVVAHERRFVLRGRDPNLSTGRPVYVWRGGPLSKWVEIIDVLWTRR